MIAIILAGGLGKRMNSDLPKPAHKIDGKSLLQHVIDKLASFERIFIVYGQKRLDDYIVPQNNIAWVHQDPQLGTGHAVQMAEDALKGFSGEILVLAGDVPFLSSETITRLIEVHRREKAAATVLSSIPPDPENYGRIVRVPGTDTVDYIVEQKDADDKEKKIGEINTGTFCFDSRYFFDSLREIRDNNSQKEYYLTDIMQILRRKGLKAAVYLTDNSDEALGVNSAEQKAYLEAKFAEKYGHGKTFGGPQTYKM